MQVRNAVAVIVWSILFSAPLAAADPITLEAPTPDGNCSPDVLAVVGVDHDWLQEPLPVGYVTDPFIQVRVAAPLGLTQAVEVVTTMVCAVQDLRAFAGIVVQESQYCLSKEPTSQEFTECVQALPGRIVDAFERIWHVPCAPIWIDSVLGEAPGEC